MRVLAVGAHPDDIEINCAGTLLKCLQRGDQVFACHMLTGSLGHVVIEPEELIKIRGQEAQNAGKLAGYEVISGGYNDLDIYDCKEARDRLVDIIRYADPDVIITHNPDDYMADHNTVSKLVFDASFAASVPHYESNNPKACKVVPIYYMDNDMGVNFVPTEFVDITDVIDLKLKMLECHESQVVWLRDHDDIDVVDMCKLLSRYRGYQCGTTYAEGFRQCPASLKMTTKRLLP